MQDLYWLFMVFGSFGAWKTFRVFRRAFDYDKRKTYIIANVPYSIVDHYYSTVDDLLKVFEVLDEYCNSTNKFVDEFYFARDQVKDIVLIVDEAHLYLNSREATNKNWIIKKLMLIFTQCRKRKIKIYFISQRLTQVDIVIRRLSDYVEELTYHKFFNIEYVKDRIYLNKWDVADIETDTIAKDPNWDNKTKEDSLVYSGFFSPLTTWLEFLELFRPWYKAILREEFQTYHICGLEDDRVKDFNLNILLDNLVIVPDDKQKLKLEEKWIPILQSLKDLHDNYEKSKKLKQKLKINDFVNSRIDFNLLKNVENEKNIN